MRDLFGETTEYRCLLADPPWAERGGGKIKRGADRHYPLMDRDEIVRTMRGSGVWTPAESAHVWIWVTDNFLLDGLATMEALGFRYVRTFVWVKIQVDEGGVIVEGGRPKVRFGIGQYGRGAHELLLFGVRGSGQDPSVWVGNRDVPSVFFAPVPRDDDGKRIHSRKPPESYELIERVSRGPRVELFARTRYNDSWTVWGNQAPGEETAT